LLLKSGVGQWNYNNQTKPNHNFLIKKLQKNNEELELLIIFHAIGNKRNFFYFREEEEDEENKNRRRREKGRKKLEKIKTKVGRQKGVGRRRDKRKTEKIKKKGKQNESKKKFDFYFFNLPKCQWGLSWVSFWWNTKMSFF
jgi:hypothetical protein